MKAATTQLQTMLQQGYDLRAVPKVRAEWEHNRYSKIQSVTVSPTQTADSEWDAIFNLDSITLPNRPRNGVAKARLGTNKLKAAKKYRDSPTSSRFYLPTETDPFKYFSSTQKCGAVQGGDGGYAFTTPITLSIVHEEDIVANKIVVGFETSYSAPKTFTLQVTTNGTTWTTVASPSLDSKGQATVWLDGVSSWTTIPVYTNVQVIRGVRVVVASMTDANSHVDVIQLGARLENDLSDFMEGYSKEFDISDRSFIAPLGQASSNSANVTLSNIDRRFNNTNEDSLYFNLIGKKTKITVDLSYNVLAYGGTADERIREFVMWTESWGGQDETSVTLELKDSSIFLQEVQVPKVFWEGLTVGAVIWEMMDILGFTNYSYNRDVLDAGQVVPYFWPDPDTTAWEQISQISEGTQTAVYFDENDVLQIRPRNYAFRPNRPVDWNLDAIQNGQKLPDIVSIEINEEIAANKVDVKYSPAKFSDFNNGLPKMETVWEPEDGTITLRASSLTKDLLTTDTALWIPYQEAAIWPYNATVNIRGEILSYKGKEYTWNQPNGAKAQTILYSQEDKDRVDSESNPDMAWANAYTGKLIIEKRNIAGTGLVNHVAKPAGYTGILTNYENTQFGSYPTTGMKYANGRVTLTPPNGLSDHHLLVYKHESSINSSYTTYGMRIRFPSIQRLGTGWACGGLWFAGDFGDAGYYLEMSPTDVVTAENRVWRHEMYLTRMPQNAKANYEVGLGQPDAKGFQAAIVKDKWYDVTVRHSVNSNGSASITAYLDGVLAGRWLIPSAKRATLGEQNKFGMFTRGVCNIEVESLYAVYQEAAPEPDQSTFLNLVNGGFTSGYIEREWRYGYYTTTGRASWHEGGAYIVAQNSRANYALDEFGPIVHEVREFDVAFDEDSVPVAHSFPYVSNESQVACVSYWANAFGAKFVLVNSSRQNAIVSGEDTLTFGSENSVNQKLLVYGRVLYQEDDQTVTKKDDDSIRRNGTIALDFDNRFIQSDQAATSLGEWIVGQWNTVSEELEVEVFGNPLFQMGDLVTINYPVKDMDPTTHRYYVVSANNQWEDGLSSKLILRRVKS